MPFINTILEDIAGHQVYTLMDGYSGYNQIQVAQRDQHKTAFTTPWDTFICLVMCFGLCNGPATFQRVMTFAFSDLFYKSMIVFIDNFSTHSKKEDHLYWVHECLIPYCNTRIAINPDKLFVVVVRRVF